MATNIEIDEDLMLQAMSLTGYRTKRAVVEEALRTLIRLHDQREVRDLRGRLHWEDGRRPEGEGKRRGGDAGAR